MHVSHRLAVAYAWAGNGGGAPGASSHYAGRRASSCARLWRPDRDCGARGLRVGVRADRARRPGQRERRCAVDRLRPDDTDHVRRLDRSDPPRCGPVHPGGGCHRLRGRRAGAARGLAVHGRRVRRTRGPRGPARRQGGGHRQHRRERQYRVDLASGRRSLPVERTGPAERRRADQRRFALLRRRQRRCAQQHRRGPVGRLRQLLRRYLAHQRISRTPGHHQPRWQVPKEGPRHQRAGDRCRAGTRARARRG